MPGPHATDHPVLILMAQQRCTPPRRRPQPVAPAPLKLGELCPPSRPRRPDVAAHAPRSPRPPAELKICATRRAAFLPTLAKDAERLSGLREGVFAQDAIRLPATPAFAGNARGLGGHALSAIATPVMGTVLLGLLAGLKLG